MVERKPRLEGKVAIVTGAGSRGPGVGNGKAAAVLFAARAPVSSSVTCSWKGLKRHSA